MLSKRTLLLLGSFLSLFSLSMLAQATDNEKILRLATTTSTENSGLLDVLLPAFEQQYTIEVQTIAVGTGKALRLAEMGDVDIVMVHARNAEEAFIDQGFGVERIPFMYNHFIITGTADDPAGIAKADSAEQALQKIYRSKNLFISRGDDSGTHKREQAIWHAARLSPNGETWYREAGQGMGKVLQIASELNAYALTDRGTWLKVGKRFGLEELFTSHPALYNPYSVIAVNPTRHPHVNQAGTAVLIEWLQSSTAQQIIDQYKIDGQRAFIPLHLN